MLSEARAAVAQVALETHTRGSVAAIAAHVTEERNWLDDDDDEVVCLVRVFEERGGSVDAHVDAHMNQAHVDVDDVTGFDAHLGTEVHIDADTEASGAGAAASDVRSENGDLELNLQHAALFLED